MGHGRLRLYPDSVEEREFLDGLMRLLDGVSFDVLAVDKNPDLTAYGERSDKENNRL